MIALGLVAVGCYLHSLMAKSAITKHPFFLRLFPNEVKAHKAFHTRLQSVMPLRGRVLDLGCGDHGELAAYRTAEREIWGADFQRHPRLQHPHWFRLLGERGTIPFEDGCFDVVAANWVLEHVESPAFFLREVGRVLRPGGWFVALSVNGDHYVTLLARLLGLLPHEATQALVKAFYGRAAHDTFPTFYRLNTERDLRHAGRAAGLPLQLLTRHVNPAYFGRLWRLAAAADWVLERVRTGLGRIYLTASFQKPPAWIATAAAA